MFFLFFFLIVFIPIFSRSRSYHRVNDYQRVNSSESCGYMTQMSRDNEWHEKKFSTTLSSSESKIKKKKLKENKRIRENENNDRRLFDDYRIVERDEKPPPIMQWS